MSVKHEKASALIKGICRNQIFLFFPFCSHLEDDNDQEDWANGDGNIGDHLQDKVGRLFESGHVRFGGCDVTEDPNGSSVRLQESEVGQVVALALRALAVCVGQPAPPVGPAMSVAVPEHANRGPRLLAAKSLGPHVVEGDFHRLLENIKGSFIGKMKKDFL